MTDKGIQFDFLVRGRNGYFEPEVLSLGGKIMRILPRKKRPVKSLLAEFRTIKNNGYEVITVSSDHSLIFLDLLIAFLAGVRVRIAWSHFSECLNPTKARIFLHYLFRPFCRMFATGHLACTDEASVWLFGKNISDHPDYIRIHNAIPAEAWVYDREKQRTMRQALGLGDKKVIAHVGRFSREKNHVFLLSVFDEILKRDPDFHLILAGWGTLENEIRARAEAMGILDGISFLGLRNDLPDVLQAADCFVMPSLSEGLGIACIEAQAAGLRCFISDKIPGEAMITDRVVQLNLSDGAAHWAREIVNAGIVNAGFEKTNTCGQIREAGYDIAERAGYLANLLLNCQENAK